MCMCLSVCLFVYALLDYSVIYSFIYFCMCFFNYLVVFFSLRFLHDFVSLSAATTIHTGGIIPVHNIPGSSPSGNNTAAAGKQHVGKLHRNNHSNN